MRKRRLAASVLLAFTSALNAQPTPTAPSATQGHASHTVSTTVDVPPLAFRSVFERYQSFRDEKVGSWREGNDTVTRVGGWREYLKEAQRPETNEAPAISPDSRPSAPPPNKADPHAGHGAKK